MREPHPQSHATHRPLGHGQLRDVISPLSYGIWIPNLAEHWLLCVYYDRGLRRRKLGDPSISLFLSFFFKKV